MLDLLTAGQHTVQTHYCMCQYNVVCVWLTFAINLSKFASNHDAILALLLFRISDACSQDINTCSSHQCSKSWRPNQSHPLEDQ